MNFDGIERHSPETFVHLQHALQEELLLPRHLAQVHKEKGDLYRSIVNAVRPLTRGKITLTLPSSLPLDLNRLDHRLQTYVFLMGIAYGVKDVDTLYNRLIMDIMLAALFITKQKYLHCNISAELRKRCDAIYTQCYASAQKRGKASPFWTINTLLYHQCGSSLYALIQAAHTCLKVSDLAELNPKSTIE